MYLWEWTADDTLFCGLSIEISDWIILNQWVAKLKALYTPIIFNA